MKSGTRIAAFVGVGILVALIIALTPALLLVPASSQRVEAQSPTVETTQAKTTTITVRGSGSASAVPNTIVLNAGVASFDTTVKAAQDKSNSVTAAMVAKLKAANVADKDYKTSQYTVEPVMDYSGDPKGGTGSTPKLTGFRVTNMLEITLHDTNSAAAVLDQLVAAGANTIYNVAYTFSDPSSLTKQAYDSAVKDGQSRAERLASLSNMTLGRIINVTESSANVPGVIYSDGGKGMGGGGAQVYPGQQSVQSDVIITYEAAAK